MSSGGGDTRCCTAAATPQQGEEQEEDFYDCQEDLVPPEDGEKQHHRTGSEGSCGQTGQEGEQEEAQSQRPQEEAQSQRPQEEAQSQRPQEEAQSHRPQEEQEDDLVPPEAGDTEHSGTVSDRRKECKDESGEWEDKEVHRLQEEDQQQDSDSELKAEVGPGVEFDDDYLREVEKDLSEEELESRRQESLTLKEAGNGLFKAGDWAEAARSYTAALALCPVCFSKERSILFSNRAAARGHLDLKDSALSDCSRAIDLNPDYLRALLRRAELYEQTEKLDEALEDYKKVLERDPSHTGARQACMRLPQQIQERNEKLKEEMMSKLKDLGNMILRPFGLSTNNFQVNQDSASGSYSINFVQNPNNNNR